MVQVVDYSHARPGAAAIRDADYAGAIRYLSPNPAHAKNWNADMLAEHRAAGLFCGFVWETTLDRCTEGRAAGVEDSRRANAMCDQFGVPATVAIYYACDRPGHTPTDVRPYFDGLLSEAGRPVGVYGSREVVEAMLDHGCRFGWQVETWTGIWSAPDGTVVGPTAPEPKTPLLSPRAHIVQLARPPRAIPRIAGTDVNDVQIEDWGAWPPPGLPFPGTKEEEVFIYFTPAGVGLLFTGTRSIVLTAADKDNLVKAGVPLVKDAMSAAFCEAAGSPPQVIRLPPQ